MFLNPLSAVVVCLERIDSKDNNINSGKIPMSPARVSL